MSNSLLGADALIGDKHRAAEPQLAGSLDDSDLVKRIVETGSSTHFRLLLERHQQSVFQLVSSVLGPHNSSRVEEVCQEAFLKIHRNLSKFRLDSSFGTWAYRITYNTALDQLRAIGRRPKTTPLEEKFANQPSQQPSPAALAEQDGQADRMRAAVDQLPYMYRTLIHLHYWKGLTVTEISTVLQASPGTVKSYLHRARGRLQHTLENGA